MNPVYINLIEERSLIENNIKKITTNFTKTIIIEILK